MIIEINDEKYNVEVAATDEQREKGLQGRDKLAKNSGMLFTYKTPQTVGMWMKDCTIPLDIIFINEDCEVISTITAKPNDPTIIEEDDVKYVLEVNANSLIRVGDEVDFEEEDLSDEEIDEDSEEETMKVLGPNAEIQMELVGGERIFSRKNTKILLNLAKKAYKSKSETDYRILGRKVFKFLDIQDSNNPEYVEVPDKKE